MNKYAIKQLDSKTVLVSTIEKFALPCSAILIKLSNILPRLSLCVISLACVGCASTVNIEDDNAPSAVIRVNKELGQRFSINAELTHTEGSDRRELGADQHLDLDSRIVLGPKSLENDFTMNIAAVIANFKLLDRNRLKLHLGTGLRYSALSLDIETNEGDKLNNDYNSVGAMIEFRLVAPFTERLSGEIRLAASQALVFNDDVLLMGGSVELNYELAKHLKMFGGWYQSNYENHEEASQIDIDTSGLRYGLQLDF